MSIIVDHLTYTYGIETPDEKRAINDVSFAIQDGEYIGLLGHTGSGKSTLVQLLTGLLTPQSGSVYYNGADIFDRDYDKKKLRSEVGLIFQYPEHQIFEVDVFSDVCFGPKNQGLSKSEVQLRAYEALKLVGIKDEYFYQSPFELSGGEKRRVAIAGVLAMKPKALILDEPTAGLDPRGRDEILELINRLRIEQGMTIILVSHSMDDVAENVDRIMVMDKGILRFDGSKAQVFSHYEELQEIGLDIPSVTKTLLMLKNRGFNVNTNIYTLKEAAAEIIRVKSRGF